jgi:hypothetical protein
MKSVKFTNIENADGKVVCGFMTQKTPTHSRIGFTGKVKSYANGVATFEWITSFVVGGIEGQFGQCENLRLDAADFDGDLEVVWGGDGRDYDL